MAQVTLLTAATATNSAPSGATAGVAMPHLTDRALLFAYGTCTAGQTYSVTLKLWGYNATLATWFPLGTHATAATKGVLNAGNALGETQSDSMQHCEEITSLRKIHRVYAEVTAISGTGTAVTVVLDCVNASSVTES